MKTYARTLVAIGTTLSLLAAVGAAPVVAEGRHAGPLRGVVLAAAGPLKVKNTVAPKITGTRQVGYVLTVSKGTWTGAASFTYKWLRCNSAGASCSTIAGATSRKYTLTKQDTARKIKAVVTGHHAGSTAVSKPSAAVGPIKGKPFYVSGGVITGTPAVGNMLTAVKGTWRAYPAPTFTYKWLRDLALISGETAPTYTVRAGDSGHSITCVISGSNSIALTSLTLAPVTIP